jgi:chorismate mutase
VTTSTIERTPVRNSTDIPGTDAAPQRVADPGSIATLRGQIDALDTAIARLVAERAQLSRHIQAARIGTGGTRVELGRERAILSRYRSRLGSEGGVLGEAVLRVCRGSR